MILMFAFQRFSSPLMFALASFPFLKNQLLLFMSLLCRVSLGEDLGRTAPCIVLFYIYIYILSIFLFPIHFALYLWVCVCVCVWVCYAAERQFLFPSSGFDVNTCYQLSHLFADLALLVEVLHTPSDTSTFPPPLRYRLSPARVCVDASTQTDSPHTGSPNNSSDYRADDDMTYSLLPSLLPFLITLLLTSRRAMVLPLVILPIISPSLPIVLLHPRITLPPAQDILNKNNYFFTHCVPCVLFLIWFTSNIKVRW